MGFTIVLRGYETAAVDAMMQRLRDALASTDPAVRAAVRTDLNEFTFRVRIRGYDRVEVDEYFRRAIDRLA
jgi:DivIVA domain-containing protein